MAALGVDIGGSSIKCGIVDDRGNVIARKQLEIHDRSVDVVVELIQRAATMLQEEIDLPIDSIGIGCPGQIHYGVVIGAANFPQWPPNVPLEELIRQASKIPKVTLCNDADAAVAAEHWIGAARNGIRNFIMITLGSGVGMGLVIDGKIVQGNNAVIEGGHMIVERNGRLCGCSQKGCLEMYASASAVVAEAKKRAQGTDSILHTALNARNVFESAEHGDLIAQEVIDEAADYLGFACVNLTRLLDPEMIVLSGGMAEAGVPLVHRVREAFDKYAWTKLPNTVEIRKAASGYDSGIIGAVGFRRIQLKD